MNGYPSILAVWVGEHGVTASTAEVQTVIHEAGITVTDGCVASLLACTVSIAVHVATLGLTNSNRIASACVDVLDEARCALLAVAASVALAARANTFGLDALMGTGWVTETVG